MAPRSKILAIVIALLFGFLSAAPVAAHHGWGTFDTRFAYFISGTVTHVRWGNPHSEVHIKVDQAPLPTDWARRELPPGGDDSNFKLTMASARPYTGEHEELHLVLAGPGWMESWGMNRQLEVGEEIETVGYLNADETDTLRPVIFWLSNGQSVWQQLTTFPQRPEPAPATSD